ncbi:helix-turn-helix domain-containing protein [Streptomyces sp. NPDC007025]|uniref:helix-turn-helix domain-containing protein n=1 Tax=Streptomyces sp. NPDC007025 TaxID=3364771 RepID=UPI0036AB0931
MAGRTHRLRLSRERIGRGIGSACTVFASHAKVTATTSSAPTRGVPAARPGGFDATGHPFAVHPSREHLAPGQLIRVIRREQGVTLEQLGQKTGYSAAQLSRLERGISPMTVDAFRAFADALDIPSGAPGPLPDSISRADTLNRPAAIPAFPRLR